MNALEIQQQLWKELSSASELVMPNYTPRKWWECDMMSVSKAGYWSEFEIKLSVADFRADANKCDGGGWTGGYNGTPRIRVAERFKHQELAAASDTGPSFFWFVVPDTIASKIEVPIWAGLKIATHYPASAAGEWSRHASLECVRIYTERPAPRLHKVKINPKVLEHARGVCYWRYWNLKADFNKAVKRQLQREAVTV